MATTHKIEGLKELDQALGELTKATARNTLRRALTKGAQPVKAAMESRAPRLTGYTAESIEISSTLNPANRRDAKREGKAFAEVYVGSRRGSAAHLQEFGTVDQPARPYLRPAWAATQNQALEIATEEIKVEVEKSRAKAAKKAARLAAKG